MKRSTGAWFWLGLILVSLSGGYGAIVISNILFEGNIEGILWGIIFTAIPMAIGLYGIRRGRYPDKPWEWFAWGALGVFGGLAFFGGGVFGSIKAMQTFDLNDWVVVLGFFAALGAFIPLIYFVDKRMKRCFVKQALAIKALKRSGAKFSMRVDEAFQATFTTGALGMVVGGRVEQGTITNGDEVEIRGYQGTKRAKVFEVDTPTGSGAAGEKVRLLIEALTEDDVKRGDIVERI